MNNSEERIASPVSTGGSGALFEQHVDAAFLAILLVRAAPPVFIDCVPDEVFFQTAHLGWKTDDTLLVVRDRSGQKKSLAAQVKRSFTVSQADPDCVQTFEGFWRDFHNSAIFHPEHDCFALVTLRGTDVLLGRFGALLDCARASRDETDFSHRLATPGLLQKAAVTQADDIRVIVRGVPGIEFSDAAFWRFLKAVHILSWDLNTSTRQTEAWIETLLALTAVSDDKTAVARTTWLELLKLAGASTQVATQFSYSSLPGSLRAAHNPVGSALPLALTKLTEHSATTLAIIRTSLANGFELIRPDQVTALVNLFSTGRVILVTGPAGSGKSALSKMALSRISETTFVFAFRAEEFAAPHLDQALLLAQIPANAVSIRAILAAQGRKIILVESVERLLESRDRTAFLHLLQLVADDQSFQLVLTCRDYSAETVKSSFLDFKELAATTFGVPPLSEDELKCAVESIPALARPASHPFLKELFRNPYILDKASRMSWPADATLPEDERAFREKFWRDIVRRDDESGGGMPAKRERTFAELCVSRAKALKPFVPSANLDSAAIDRLHEDNLVMFAEGTKALVAPAHDMLEDWAVVKWIDELYIRDSSASALEAALGSYPAIRRAFRKWLGERFLVDEMGADRLVLAALDAPSLAAYFKDDTLVAVLLSPSISEFLNRNASFLVENDARLLRRIIHLMRVACRSNPRWIRSDRILQSALLVPDGPAWPAVLKMVEDNQSVFTKDDVPLLIGLMTDWSQAVTWWSPSPPGFRSVAAIAFALLPSIDPYDRKDSLKQIVRIVAKVPKGDEVAFRELAKKVVEDEKSRDPVNEEFRKVILSGLEGTFACRDVPDLVIQIAKSHFLERPNRRRSHSHATELESVFGLRDTLSFEFSPQSALQGPFRALLQHHPQLGVSFILEIVNHACERYASDRSGFLETPWEITLAFPDGEPKTQWCSARLWNLYRGTAPGPSVVECALMALEAFLLDLTKVSPDHLSEWLIYLLRQSNNVAITAVVASVSCAYPRLAPSPALSLCRCRDLIDLDRSRASLEPLGLKQA
jgi:hypothetical protein